MVEWWSWSSSLKIFLWDFDHIVFFFFVYKNENEIIMMTLVGVICYEFQYRICFVSFHIFRVFLFHIENVVLWFYYMNEWWEVFLGKKFTRNFLFFNWIFRKNLIKRFLSFPFFSQSNYLEFDKIQFKTVNKNYSSNRISQQNRQTKKKCKKFQNFCAPQCVSVWKRWEKNEINFNFWYKVWNEIIIIINWWRQQTNNNNNNNKKNINLQNWEWFLIIPLTITSEIWIRFWLWFFYKKR